MIKKPPSTPASQLNRMVWTDGDIQVTKPAPVTKAPVPDQSWNRIAKKAWTFPAPTRK